MHGIHYGYADGDLSFTPNMWGGSFNAGEFGVEGTFFSTNGGICEGVYDCTHAGLSGNVHVDYFDGAGSTGDGFCNFDREGDTATFSMTGCATQQVLVRFRYALGFRNNRQMTLTVNGNVVANYDLVPTGAWSTWEYSKFLAGVQIYLFDFPRLRLVTASEVRTDHTLALQLVLNW